MTYSKTKIYNLALSHLLLSRQVTEVDSSTATNEVKVLNTFWDEALNLTLQELDLDSLSEPIPLELIETINDGGPWLYSYKYPSRCALLRKLVSCAIIDTEYTHIAKRTAIRNGQKVIFTNQESAIAECIPEDLPLALLSPAAALAVSYMLAYLASPLIVGKGAARLKQEVYANYMTVKGKAQEIDRMENFNFERPEIRSSFVAARMS